MLEIFPPVTRLKIVEILGVSTRLKVAEPPVGTDIGLVAIGNRKIEIIRTGDFGG